MLNKAELDTRLILNIMGFLLMMEGAFMLLGFPFALYYKDPRVWVLPLSTLITSGTGALIWYLTRQKSKAHINKREGFLVVSLSWFVTSFFGTLPFIISGAIPSFTDAFFETMSGFTTTGATILTDIEVLPKGILFWRSMTHWVGGMGIIVLSVAVLPFLGIGGMQLYSAEMPGITKDKLHPRITETAKRLWGIYLILTLAQTGLMMLGEMNLFDSLCHAFGTMATGGFSTKNSSIAEFSPYIQYVIIVFMILAATNFTLHYFAFLGKFRQVWHNEEFRKYLYLLGIVTAIITFLLFWKGGMSGEKALRDAMFQVVSIVTTTGYITSDYLTWPGTTWFFIFLLMFIGGMSGSTGSGIKVVRQLLLFKTAGKEMKRALHPQGIIPVRLNQEPVSQDIIFKVMAFIQIYIMVFAFGVMVMTFLGLDFESAIGATIATLGNIGPGIGDVGPTGNYAFIPDLGKWFLSVLMLLGRLELFTLLIILSSAFWKK